VEATIQLTENNFKLTFSKSPPNSVKFQIKYYGYREVDLDNELNYLALKQNINLNNLIEYLNENKIQINLCSNSKKHLEDIFKEKLILGKKIENLKKIKENISEEELDKFAKSINFLKRDLKKYQLLSCYHLFNSESAANFSVPGSGKTSVVLAYYEKLKRENKVDAIFLIGPKNCYYSWKTEFISTIGRDPNLCILAPPKKLNDRITIYKNPIKSEVYACHFTTISNDLEYLKIFASNNKFLLVVDEAHNIKKVGGKWSNAALNLSKYSNYKVILTGTPRPNQHTDFYNYIDFLYGDNEIMSTHDKARVDILIERQNLPEASKILRDKLGPFYMRITKKALKLSKPIFNKPTIIEMNPIEKKIHDAIVSKIKNYPIKEYEQNIELIKKIRRARILRLRQNCSYVKNLLSAIPNSIKEGDENLTEGIAELIATYDKKEVPAKIVTLKSLVLPLAKKKKKVLIWSTHLKTIDLIKEQLKKENLNIKSITGKTKLDVREDIKDEFNDKNSKLDAIVANPQACSESISLHKACHNAIYYDQNYNTAEFLQSLDRIHRVGGSETDPVYYDFLQYANSIDKKVYERVFAKADAQMKIIEQDNFIFDMNHLDDLDDFYNDLKL
jgi:SNF2 family DNA or RNA helicase